MQTYTCEDPPTEKLTVLTCKAKLKTDAEFATFFAEQVKLGLSGNQAAKDCVDAYYEPLDSEMHNLGIPSGSYSVWRKCTESGLLLIVAAKEGASQAI